MDSIDSLKVFPEGFSTVPEAELAEKGYRMVIYKKYISVYKIIDDTVYIYHVADGRINYSQIIKGYK